MNEVEMTMNDIIMAKWLLYRYSITKDKDLIKNSNIHLRNNNIVI